VVLSEGALFDFCSRRRRERRRFKPSFSLTLPRCGEIHGLRQRCPAHRHRRPTLPRRGNLPDLRLPQSDGVSAPWPLSLRAVLRPGRADGFVPAGWSPVARLGVASSGQRWANFFFPAIGRPFAFTNFIRRFGNFVAGRRVDRFGPRAMIHSRRR
jgi:hypothetical protein